MSEKQSIMSDSALAEILRAAARRLEQQDPYVFYCGLCGEQDTEMSAMCVRDGCPKEHGPFTKQVWVKPEC